MTKQTKEINVKIKLFQYDSLKEEAKGKAFEEHKKIFKYWNKREIKIYANEKDSPVLLCDGEGLDFILAPKMREED